MCINCCASEWRKINIETNQATISEVMTSTCCHFNLKRHIIVLCRPRRPLKFFSPHALFETLQIKLCLPGALDKKGLFFVRSFLGPKRVKCIIHEKRYETKQLSVSENTILYCSSYCNPTQIYLVAPCGGSPRVQEITHRATCSQLLWTISLLEDK